MPIGPSTARRYPLVRVSIRRAPRIHPIDILPHVLLDPAHQAEVVDVSVKVLEHAVDEGDEGEDEGGVAEVEVMVAQGEDPVEGETEDDLGQVGWETGLGETLGRDGAGEGDDGLAHESVVPAQ